jgi:PAS domain-containing serine/threonine kinase
LQLTTIVGQRDKYFSQSLDPEWLRLERSRRHIMSSPISSDGGFAIFSPSAETSCSSDDGDVLKTPPVIEHAERDIFAHHFNFDQTFLSTREQSPATGQSHDVFNSKPRCGHYFSAPPTPRLRTPPPTTGALLQSGFPVTFSSVTALDNTIIGRNHDSIEIDPFDATFAVVNEERVTHAPLIVRTSSIAACRYSSRFPYDHLLDSSFVRAYDLGDELGSGGYGFVMTAYNRAQGQEVAVKFIIKDKVSEHGWTEHEVFGRLPTEVILLTLIDHENIVKCLDLFEDELYFYLVCRFTTNGAKAKPICDTQVQELHGSPWKKLLEVLPTQPKSSAAASENFLSPPFLSPSTSEDSVVDFGPTTPLQSSNPVDVLNVASHVQIQGNELSLYHIPKQNQESLSSEQLNQNQLSLHDQTLQFARRPSHDLFECIEQTPNKRLSEDQARYIFVQIVEAAYYLDSQGITHRDIKDENLIIDKDMKVNYVSTIYEATY